MVLLPLSLHVALITKVCDFCRFYIILSGHSVCWVSLSSRPSMCFVLIILAAWYFRLCWSSLNCITIVFSEASVAAWLTTDTFSLACSLGLPWAPANPLCRLVSLLHLLSTPSTPGRPPPAPLQHPWRFTDSVLLLSLCVKYFFSLLHFPFIYLFTYSATIDWDISLCQAQAMY